MAKKQSLSKGLPKVNLNLSKFNKFKAVLAWVLAVNNVSSILSIVYYIIWIPVGLFFLWFIAANFKVGAFDQLISRKSVSAQAEAQSQPPTETTVPGIGKVNIDCVQNSLTQDAIVKIVSEKSDKSLTEEEKAKLGPCIIEKETASPETTE